MHKKRRPAMKKISTVHAFGNELFKGQKLTIGVDLGDRWSFYCVLDEAGKIILEQKVPTTSEAMKQTFSRIPQSRVALETGTHSPQHCLSSIILSPPNGNVKMSPHETGDISVEPEGTAASERDQRMHQGRHGLCQSRRTLVSERAPD